MRHQAKEINVQKLRIEGSPPSGRQNGKLKPDESKFLGHKNLPILTNLDYQGLQGKANLNTSNILKMTIRKVLITLTK